MVYYDFLSYDLVTCQSVYFCRFRVLLFTLKAFGPPSCPPIFFWRSQVALSGSFHFFGSTSCHSIGLALWVIILMSSLNSVSYQVLIQAEGADAF